MAKDAKKQECFKMIAKGVSQKDIAKKLGVSEVTISRWVNPPKEKKEIEEADLWEKLRAAAADALDTMIHLSIKAKNENIRYAAAKDILDRIGLKPDESLKVSVEPVVIVDDLKE